MRASSLVAAAPRARRRARLLLLVGLLAIPGAATAAAGNPAAPQDSPRITIDDLPDAPPRKLSDSEVTALRRLIAATPESDGQRPQLTFRLAEHARATWLEQVAVSRALPAKIAAARAPFERAALRGQLQRAEQAERPWRTEATRLYIELVQRAAARGAAAFARLDEALFHLADLMRRSQRMDQARVFFSRLIRDYPQSRTIPDAYVVFADHYFDEGKYPEAQALYKKVSTAYPTAAVADYVSYKDGWCELRRGDARRALERFVVAVRARDLQRRPALAQEVRRSIVIAYAAVGSPSKAHAFFQRVGGNDTRTMLKQLAAIYRAARRTADAAVVEAAAR